MRKIQIIVFVATILLIGGLAVYALERQISSPLALLGRELGACHSLPTDDIFTVPETSRIFVNLPKDIYPTKELETIPHGATAGYISNGGPYGEALEAQPTCWSYYLEFDLTEDNKNPTGSVDIVSKSAVAGIPDYVLHVKVERR